MTTIRVATTDDLPAINDIYNHFVRTCTCTYQEVPDTLADRTAWFARHGERYPVVVAVVDDVVAGWGSVSPFHERSAFRTTVEDSIYVAPAHQGLGLGRLLLSDLIDRSKSLGHQQMIAAIDSPVLSACTGAFTA